MIDFHKIYLYFTNNTVSYLANPGNFNLNKDFDNNFQTHHAIIVIKMKIKVINILKIFTVWNIVRLNLVVGGFRLDLSAVNDQVKIFHDLNLYVSVGLQYYEEDGWCSFQTASF